MAKNPVQSAAKKRATRARVRNDERTRTRAIRELGINVPIYRTRVVGNRLELFVYPGIALYWPPEPGDGEEEEASE